MLVAQIIKEVCDVLSLDFNDESTRRLLLRCYGVIERSTALDYFPLYCTENLSPKDGFISYEDFTFPVFSICRVTTAGGKRVNFRVVRDYLQILDKNVDNVVVSYSYSPMGKDLDDWSEYGEEYKDYLVFNTACEYLLFNCDYKRATEFTNKVIEELDKLKGNHEEL